MGLAALLLTSCFEGEDLAEVYQSLYQAPSFLHLSTTAVGQTSAQVNVNINYFKSDGELRLYYAEGAGSDPLAEGKSIEVTNPAWSEQIEQQHQIALTDLLPGCTYRYCLAYSDAGVQQHCSDVQSFTTTDLGFAHGIFGLSDYFSCTYWMYVKSPLAGMEYGYLFGTETEAVTPTIDHCQQRVKLGVAQNTREITEYPDDFNDLEPATGYHLRVYAIYKDRVFYSDTEHFVMPRFEVVFDSPSFHYDYSNKHLLSCSAHQLNLIYEPQAFHPKVSLGFQVGQSPSLDDAVEYPSQNQSAYVQTHVDGLTPGATYYYRAYARYRESEYLSDIDSFVAR